jgi:hypothetical protein
VVGQSAGLFEAVRYPFKNDIIATHVLLNYFVSEEASICNVNFIVLGTSYDGCREISSGSCPVSN